MAGRSLNDVSVIMISWSPSPERMDMLRRSFQSLQETAPGVELIVVDNGPACQSQWLATQPITTWLRPPKNLGIAHSRNYGAEHARGEYLAFVDTDLVYFPGWLGQAVGVLERYPQEKLIVAPPLSSPMRRTGMHVGKLDDYDLYNLASGQCQVFRRADWEALGPWPIVADGKGPKEDSRHAEIARALGYRYVRHPAWHIEHLGEGVPSFNHRYAVDDPRYARPCHTLTRADRVRLIEDGKREFIRQHAGGRRILVETGTREGDTIAYLLRDFDRLYTIEIDPDRHARASARFASSPQVTCIAGDTRQVLPSVVGALNQAAVFWLDAHFFGTASEGGKIDVPILDELREIARQPHGHLVLIDDAKVFVDWRHRTEAFPTVQQISDTLRAGDPNWNVRIENNIIIAQREDSRRVT